MSGQRLYATSATPGRVVYGPFGDVGYIVKNPLVYEKTEAIQQVRYERRQMELDARKDKRCVSRMELVNRGCSLLDMVKVRSSVNRLVELGLQQAEDELNWRRNKLRKQLLEEQEKQFREYTSKAQTALDVRLAEEKRRADEILERKANADKDISKAVFERQHILNSEEFKNKLHEENMVNMLNALQAHINDNRIAKLAKEEEDKIFDAMREQDFERVTKEREHEENVQLQKRREYSDALQKQVEANRILKANKDCVDHIEQNMTNEVRREMDRKYEIRDAEERKNKVDHHRRLLEQIQVNREIAAKKKEEDLMIDRMLVEDDMRKKQEELAKRQDNRKKAWSELVIFKEALNQYRTDVLRQEAITEAMADKLRVEVEAERAQERIGREKRRRQLNKDVAKAAVDMSADKSIRAARSKAMDNQRDELLRYRNQMQDQLDEVCQHWPLKDVDTKPHNENQVKYLKVLEQRQIQQDRDMLDKMRKVDEQVRERLEEAQRSGSTLHKLASNHVHPFSVALKNC